MSESMPPLTAQDMQTLTLATEGAVVASIGALISATEERSGQPIENVDQKWDGSFVTEDDQASSQAAEAVYQVQLPAVKRRDEELGDTEIFNAGSTIQRRIRQEQDPLDGTGPRAMGAHVSTVLGGSFDVPTRRFVTGAIGHPDSSTITQLEYGLAVTSKVRINPDGTYELSDSVVNHTWPGSISDSGRKYVLLDFMGPYERKDPEGNKYVVSEAANIQRFLKGLHDRGLIPSVYGSNGYNHMLLARGGAHIVGAVMLAQGGTWDAIGAEVAMGAGAARRAFKVLDGRRNAEERPANDPSTWDILALGNDQDAADVLGGLVEEAYAKKPSTRIYYLAKRIASTLLRQR